MCGIAGYINRGSQIRKNPLKRMLNRLSQRGPDHQEAIHVSPNLSFGYTRFAIMDSRNGNQPFPNETESISCIFNGEIYNWRELRRWLVYRGHHLHTHCDGETLPHLYEEYGLDFPVKLEGMYAIAIFDFRNDRLFLVRDRMGEKPLYYSFQPKRFLFASDIPALVASGLINTDLDLQSVAEFFTFRCVPHTHTILKSVNRLEPGSTLVFDYGRWSSSSRVYWHPNLTSPQITSEEKATEKLSQLLFNSVKLRTNIDKNLKVGTSLSGGIDSSTITALAKNFLGNHDLHSFSVHVKDDPEDLTAIQKVTRKVKTKHHWVDCNTEDVKLLPSIVYLMGEPISAGMNIPSYQCYQEARSENVRVLFTGDGSDELFAGYSGRLIIDGIIKRWDTLDAHTQTNYLKEVPGLADKLNSPLANPSLSVLERYVIWEDDNCFDLTVSKKLLQGSQLGTLDPLIRLRQLEALTAGTPHENAMLFLELRLRLEGFMLAILDRTSMSCPVECRSPYLDNQIVDLAFRLAPQLKFSQGREKYILRQVMAKTKLLPPQVVWRKKHPFAGPISTWIDNLPPGLTSLFSLKILDHYGLVNSRFVSQMYHHYQTGKLDKRTRISYSDLLFAVLVLTLWLEIFLRGRSPTEFYSQDKP